MHVWLVKLEEPVLIDKDYRPYRMGMLSDALVKAGHKVTRWCSDRNHLTGQARFGKKYLLNHDPVRSFIFLSSGINYKSSVSLLRFLDNYLLTLQFIREAKKFDRPDVIICSMPTPGMARASASLSKYFNTPLIVDARDYWPEVIDNELSLIKRLLAKPLLWKMKRDLRVAAKTAFSLVGITDFFRDHLLNYAGRDLSPLDRVFHLGFSASNEVLSGEDLKEIKGFLAQHNIRSDGTQKIIYFAGRLNSTVYNALNPVVEAASKLLVVEPEVTFVLCGSGQYSNAIREKFSTFPNVIFPGEVDTKALLALRHISVAALQSIEKRVDYQNSFSNKFCEYLSSGLPVLSWLDGVSGKKLEESESGFVYADSDELVRYVQLLVRDDAFRQKMSKNAFNLFNREFDANTIYAKFSDHVVKVVESFSLRGK